MDTSTEFLDESMIDVIERAEAFLSAHSTLLNRESQQNQSADNLFDSSSASVASFATADGSSNSSSSHLNNFSLPGTSNDNTSESSSSSRSRSEPGRIEILSDDSDNANDSSSTEPYEVELPEAVPYVQRTDSTDNDDCVVIPSNVPVIDLCLSVCDDFVANLSPQSRRNRRRRLAATAPIVELITLDDTIAESQQSSRCTAIAGLNAGPQQAATTTANASSNIAMPPPAKRSAYAGLDLDSSESSEGGGGAQSSAVNCPICFDSIFKKQASSTICGHLFCHSCITQEIQLRKKCPLCKRKLTRGQVHPIFFN